MKLDVTCMRYLTKDDYRVLQAVEMGMRNHELVPVPLIAQIAKLKHGGSFKVLSTLLRYKLVAHANNQYDGYRLSYLGFDILALRTLLAHGVIASVGAQIGVGKESDVFEAMDEQGNEVVIKIHRLGRTSFRAVRRHRDYMTGKHKASWLYMSRLAATKEYAFMQILYNLGFPTPQPLYHNRHVVAMSRVYGIPLCQLRASTMTPEVAKYYFNESIRILTKLTQHGLVHCDLNEFNLILSDTVVNDHTVESHIDDDNNSHIKPPSHLPHIITNNNINESGDDNNNNNNNNSINDTNNTKEILTNNESQDQYQQQLQSSYGQLILIDFPQIVSTSHINAKELFQRDLDGLIKFFQLKMKYIPDDDENDIPIYENIIQNTDELQQVYNTLFAPHQINKQDEYNDENSNDNDNDNLSDDDNGDNNNNNKPSTKLKKNQSKPLASLFSKQDDDLLLHYIQSNTSTNQEDTMMRNVTNDNNEEVDDNEVDDDSDNDDDDDDDDDDQFNIEEGPHNSNTSSNRHNRQHYKEGGDENIKDRIRMELRHNKKSQLSMNSEKRKNNTKKRNKYGKIDRSTYGGMKTGTSSGNGPNSSSFW